MVGLRFNRYLNAWEIIDHHGYEMYIVRNCANVNRLYKGLDKTKLNWYAQVPLEVYKQEPLPQEDVRMDGKMDISLLLTVAGKSITTNEYKIKDAPKEVVIELEKLLIETLTKFMAAHQA